MITDSRSRPGSFTRLRKQSPAPLKSNAFATQGDAAYQLQQAKEKLQRSGRQGLSLQTKLRSASLSQAIPSLKSPVALDHNTYPPEEELVEVISMSPAVAIPFRRYSRARSLATNHSLPQSASCEVRQPRKSSASSLPVNYKPTVGKGHFNEVEKKAEDQPYFGQVVNSFDLVANNIEKAVEAMR